MERKTRNNQRTAWRPDRTAAFSNAGDTAVPLMQFVAGKLPDAKRNDIKAWLKHGQVKLAGSVTSQFDEPVEPGANRGNQLLPVVAAVPPPADDDRL